MGRANAADLREAERRLAAHLAARSLRLTGPRRTVLRATMALGRHFELARLEAAVAADGVHRATLYRTLPILEAAGLLRRVRDRHSHWHYEHLVGHAHHDHLVCVRCGRVVEFVSGAIEREQARLCRRSGFLEVGHTLSIRGLCPRCRRRDRPRGKGPRP